MVYIHSWQAFQEKVEALYVQSPVNTRYCVKWRSSEGKLVLKVTDDTTCLKFKTHSSIFLNRFEQLNFSLMQKMQNRRPAPVSELPASLSTQSNLGVPGAPQVAAPASTVSPSPSGSVAAGGVKKKKPKKKK
jgi:signal recognition particle subunit SRP9